MRTMRSLISKRGQIFLLWNSWELWEPWFHMGDKFSFAESYENYEKSNFKEGTNFLSLKFMRTLRTLLSEGGQVFFHWKLWELWEPWFQRRKISLSENHENSEKPDFEEGTSFHSLKIMRTMKSCFERRGQITFSENYENSEKPDLKEGTSFPIVCENCENSDFSKGSIILSFCLWESWEVWNEISAKVRNCHVSG